MSKLVSVIAILTVALAWGGQYIFFQNLPPNISSFAFLTLTNALGAVAAILVVPKKNVKIGKHYIYSFCKLGGLMFLANYFIVMGTRVTDASTGSFLSAVYIVFFPLFRILQKKGVSKLDIVSMVITLVGVFLGTGATFSGMFNIGFLYLMMANLAFATYMVTLEEQPKEDNPYILAIGQMVVIMLISFVAWMVTQPETLFALPREKEFWISVVVIGLCIRFYATLMQVYVLKFMKAMTASILLSVNIVFTAVLAATLPKYVGGEIQEITAMKLLGCGLIIFAVVLSSGILSKKKEA